MPVLKFDKVKMRIVISIDQKGIEEPLETELILTSSNPEEIE